MRRLLVPAALVAALALPSAALAGGDPPTAGTLPAPPEFAPPPAAPVVDVPTAEAFIKRVARFRAAQFLSENPRRVRVTDVDARCLEHPVLADQFGCVFTLRAAVIQRARGWDDYPGHTARVASKRGHGNPTPQPRPRRVRVRNFGCLGLASVIGGPTVTPSVSIPFVRCARAPRGDWDAPEPTPVPY